MESCTVYTNYNVQSKRLKTTCITLSFVLKTASEWPPFDPLARHLPVVIDAIYDRSRTSGHLCARHRGGTCRSISGSNDGGGRP
jgi:hypothetical protein